MTYWCLCTYYKNCLLNIFACLLLFVFGVSTSRDSIRRGVQGVTHWESRCRNQRSRLQHMMLRRKGFVSWTVPKWSPDGDFQGSIRIYCSIRYVCQYHLSRARRFQGSYFVFRMVALASPERLENIPGSWQPDIHLFCVVSWLYIRFCYSIHTNRYFFQVQIIHFSPISNKIKQQYFCDIWHFWALSASRTYHVFIKYHISYIKYIYKLMRIYVYFDICMVFWSMRIFYCYLLYVHTIFGKGKS